MAKLTAEFMADIDREVALVKEKMVEVRRDIHRHPERSKREQRTSNLVAEHLAALGLEVTRGQSIYSVVGLLRGDMPGKTVALRADIDALKLQEQTGLPFASENEGVMHACGHDAHTAILLGVAQVLTRMKHQIPGNVKFLFQPSEEAFPGGALGMIQEGALQNPKVDAVFGCHVAPSLPTGSIGIRDGQSIGGVVALTVRVKGKGGHFGMPHLAVDPITAAAHVIIALQSFMTRRIDPNEPAVLTFGTIQGGVRDSIIGEEVLLRGDLGAMNDRLRNGLPKRLEKVAKSAAGALGASAEVEFWLGYPTVVNDPQLTELVAQVGREALGKRNVVVVEPNLGGEDFAYFQKKVPGVMWRLGVWDRARFAEPPRQHDPKFDLDEAALPVGARVTAGLALGYLSQHTKM